MEPQELMEAHPWAVWTGVVVGPFIQEDAALFAAAALAAGGTKNPALVFLVFLAALSVSDLWKYGVGRLAHSYPRAQRLALKFGLERARPVVERNLLKTLFTVRFIPGLRIAAYVAAGFVRAPFPIFLFGIVGSAALLTGMVFALFQLLGMAAGEKAMFYAGFAGGGAILLFFGITAFKSFLKRRAAS